MTYSHVIFFDGLCNLCNSSVNFIIHRDKKLKFKFASLQSNYANETLLNFKLGNKDIDTIIFVEEGKIYTKSSAVLRIFLKLDGLWFCFYPLIIIPVKFRDLVYDYIARNRYKWFGLSESCRLPKKDDEFRFIK